MLRNSLQATEDETPPEGLAAQILEETEKLKQQLADADKETLSKRESIEQLKQDLKSLEESNRRLEGGTKSEGQPGQPRQGFRRQRRSTVPDRSQDQRRARARARRRLRQHARRDRRQRDPAAQHVGGTAADRPTSGDGRSRPSTGSRRRSRRSRSSRSTRSTRRPSRSSRAAPASGWRAAMRTRSTTRCTQMRKLVPTGRYESRERVRRRHHAHAAAGQRHSRHGRPADAGCSAARDSQDRRRRATAQAVRAALGRLPSGIPVNMILLPMEGDPMAPSAFWALARKTDGVVPEPGEGLAMSRRMRGREFSSLQHVVPGHDLLRVRRGRSCCSC